MLTIAQLSGPDDIIAARDLVTELTTWAFSLGSDHQEAPAFADLETELATLPGPYAPPKGCFLLARMGGKPVGCVAFADLGDGIVELKRMYVLPDQRGNGIGAKLVDALITQARSINARRITLDSYYTMTGAHRIYRAAGFRDIPAPAAFPEQFKGRVVFMEMDLI